MVDSVQVSILCLAYNHEKYIRQCLDGFVMQKDIKFEIIIHDDASNDHTPDIIREYAKKYPELFKPIYQTENQYSQHIEFGKIYMVPMVTGKYVAICEGDDYWTDPYKLKRQFDALEANPDCYMCLHKVGVVKEDGSDIGYTCPREDISTGKLEQGYICKHYDNAKYIHTSSFFAVASEYKNYISNPPRFRQVAPVGDIPMLLFFTALGNLYYMNEVMSHYRFESIGSWSYRNKNDIEKEKRRREIDKKMKAMFEEYCEFTENKYYDYLKDVIIRFSTNEYWYCIQHHDYKALFSEFSTKELREFGLDNKAMLKMRLSIWFPRLFKV